MTSLKKSTKFASLALIALGMAAATPALAQDTNVVDDFNNGNVDGGTSTGGTNFTAQPFTPAGCLGSASLSCFSPQPTTGDFTPTVAKNNGTSTVNVATLSVPTDYLLLHPAGPQFSNVDGTARFTATQSGVYKIDGNFLRLDNTSSGDGVIASVFQSGIATALFSTTIAATNTAAQSFSVFATLAVGDSILFAVNSGGANNHSFDSTGLQAVITSIPETSTWAMMIFGLGMVGGALRSRRGIKAISFA